jgi:hypothetical protein
MGNPNPRKQMSPSHLWAGAEFQRMARERLKLGSFWLGKPRQGFTEICTKEQPLMKAGPCGSFTPSMDLSRGSDPTRKKFQAGEAA